MEYAVVLTEEFEGWLKGLRDRKARRQIAARLIRVSAGNFGDHKGVGDGVSELRIRSGPGYRAYYTVRGNEIVFMLCGGDKSTQQRDIERAKEMAAEIE